MAIRGRQPSISITEIETSDPRVVVDAARIEPVSTPKFPASREFSREFFEKTAPEGDSRL